MAEMRRKLEERDSEIAALHARLAGANPPLPPSDAEIAALATRVANMEQTTAPATVVVTQAPHPTPVPPNVIVQPAGPSMPSLTELVSKIVHDLQSQVTGSSMVYKRPYPSYVDHIPYPKGYHVPQFTMFDGTLTSILHILSPSVETLQRTRFFA